MRIQNNITALNTHRMYTINNSSIAKSAEKLSSGYRINRAGDDAAGLAISEKMRAQIRGLTMASKNSSDAISLVQTAEGALQESHNILQRMRELAVQSASDTNETTIDRAALQAEFQQLINELDDTANKARFNDMGLIDGTFAQTTLKTTTDSTVPSGVQAFVAGAIGAGQYDVTVTAVAATAASFTAATAATATVTAPSSSYYAASVKFDAISSYGAQFNGSEFKSIKLTSSTDTGVSQWTITDQHGFTYTGVGDFTGAKDGDEVKITFDGIGTLTVTMSADFNNNGSVGMNDISSTLANTSFKLAGGVDGVSTAAKDAYYELEMNGEVVKVSAGDTKATFSQGITFTFDKIGTIEADAADSVFTAAFTLAINPVAGKPLVIQTGANQYDELRININRMDSETLGVKFSSIDTQSLASSAISQVNSAINKVSTQRAALGALQNRLDHKIANLDNTAENLQAAESRIRDVDIAKEMTTFTKNNILAQASTAMLAQANAAPQNVLSLLQ